jgi:hypothetical protein
MRRWRERGPRGPAAILLLLEDGRITIADLQEAPEIAQVLMPASPPKPKTKPPAICNAGSTIWASHGMATPARMGIESLPVAAKRLDSPRNTGPDIYALPSFANSISRDLARLSGVEPSTCANFSPFGVLTCTLFLSAT